MAGRSRRPSTCVWCGRPVPDTGMGRRRRYCRQSCRQRAYEQRAAVKGTSVPDDAIILTADEATALADRAFEVRCLAEDVATAIGEGADADDLAKMCTDLVERARDAERIR